MLIFPVITRTPETSVGAGLVSSYTFRPQRSDSLSRTSNVQSVGLYTLNRQLLLVVDGTIYFPGEQYIGRFQVSHSRFPDRFWGLGNQTPRSHEEAYSFSQVYINPQLLRNLFSHLYLGLAYQYQWVYDVRYPPDGRFSLEEVRGREGYRASGAGLVLAWDRRNNAFSPSKGEFFQFSINRFDGRLGSDYNFTNYTLDFRKFVGLSSRQVLAFQLLGNVNQGEVPFRSLAILGGASLMRGYYEGRFRDKGSLAGQIEFRQAVWWKFGLVAFAGIGQVSGQVRDFRLDGFKYAVGGGIRFAIKEKEKLNLRLDYGITNSSSGVYFMIAEAF